MSIDPLAIGVCSWSLQVKSIPELSRLLERLGIDVVQIACGDPHHADWAEGDALPAAARSPCRSTGRYAKRRTFEPLGALRREQWEQTRFRYLGCD